ncbi:MAG TPA: hypothetical protein VEI97_09645 [bacterium]|nr:hypothetical protein [bacterium]
MRHRGTVGLIALLLLAVLAPSAYPQGEGGKKQQFQVAATDEASRTAVIAKSRARKGQFDAFKDRNGDGIFDQVTIPGVGDLPVDIDLNEAQGFTYATSGDTTRRVVFYPAREAKIPRDSEFLCFGFVHYFDDAQLSSWFACVVYKVPDQAKVEAQGTKKLSPYKADFIDRAGNRVGTPALLLLNTSAIGSNPDFQRWQKADNAIVLGYNPIAENRELFIFRKLPQIPDKVMMIFFRWF